MGLNHDELAASTKIQGSQFFSQWTQTFLVLSWFKETHFPISFQTQGGDQPRACKQTEYCLIWEMYAL